MWSNGAISASITVSNAATYTVTQTVNGCTSAAGSGTSAPKAVPTAPLVGTITQPTCSVITGSVVLSGLPSSGTWTLTRSPGVIVTTGTGVSTTISELASGTYTYTVTNSVGCTSLPTALTINPQPGICNVAIFHTTVTCSDYRNNATSQLVGQLCYTTKANKVSNVTPGQFFYYTAITAPSTSFTVDVIETKSRTDLALFGIQQQTQIILWDANCVKAATGTQVSIGQGKITISNAIPGTQYVLSVKYDSKSIVGSTFTGTTAPTCTYKFVSKINGVVVNGSTASIDMVPNCSSTIAKMASTEKTTTTVMDVDLYPVPFKDKLSLIYKFETNSEVKIEIFNSSGSLLSTQKDKDVYMNKELPLEMNFGILPSEMYLIKVTTSEGSIIKKVVSE